VRCREMLACHIRPRCRSLPYCNHRSSTVILTRRGTTFLPFFRGFVSCHKHGCAFFFSSPNKSAMLCCDGKTRGRQQC
jgi:hypothetical protein